LALHLRCDHISFTYSSLLAPPHQALTDVSLSISEGEILGIVGASGSGKTTLIQHFNGLFKPTSGRLFVDDVDIHVSGFDQHALRRRVGLVFQFPEIQLFEETVFQDISFGPRQLGLSAEEIESRVRSALSQVGLDEPVFRFRSPFQLSGGERRRVALAGVLAMEPEILVLDEPTVGLDRRASLLVEEIIRAYHASGKTVVFVSHNLDFVSRLAERIVVMHRGRILFDDGKIDLFRRDKILKQTGLAMPQVPAFMTELARKGFSVRMDVYTVEEAKEEIKRLAEGRNR
jgi:energy-coupling factor transport system ATP-binding protein